MGERERILGLALFFLILVSWLSFWFHQDLRFAGSFYGGMLGLAATFFLLTTFIYVFVKRISRLRRITLKYFPMRIVLRVHVYAGILGAILAILHTGHKFQSILGIWLIATMLGVIVSGFVGQYLLTFIAEEVREKRTNLSILEQCYRDVAVTLAAHPEKGLLISTLRKFRFRLPLKEIPEDLALARKAFTLGESIADTEYALQSHLTIKSVFSLWIWFHITLSITFVVLLIMHIWSSVYFGLRWLP